MNIYYPTKISTLIHKKKQLKLPFSCFSCLYVNILIQFTYLHFNTVILLMSRGYLIYYIHFHFLIGYHLNSISNLPILALLLFRNSVLSLYFLMLLVSLLPLPLLRLVFPRHQQHYLFRKSLRKS